MRCRDGAWTLGDNPNGDSMKSICRQGLNISQRKNLIRRSLNSTSSRCSSRKVGAHSTFRQSNSTRIHSSDFLAYLGTFFSWVSHGTSDTWIPLWTSQCSLATIKYVQRNKEKANEGGAKELLCETF